MEKILNFFPTNFFLLHSNTVNFECKWNIAISLCSF